MVKNKNPTATGVANNGRISRVRTSPLVVEGRFAIKARSRPKMTWTATLPMTNRNVTSTALRALSSEKKR